MSSDSFTINKELELVIRILSSKFSFDYEEAIDKLKQSQELPSQVPHTQTHSQPHDEPQSPQSPTNALTEPQLRQQRAALFDEIASKIKTQITTERIASYKTSKGDTQKSERDVISDIKTILDADGISYTEAGSQQSKDFRNVGNIGLDIEIKKTDSTTIYFNDTCPNQDIYYVIFMTGKTPKKATKAKANTKATATAKIIPAQVICINGHELVKDSPWVYEYQLALEQLKDKYARGEGKKQMTGKMSVYPRPTYRADISEYIRELTF